MLFGKKNQTNTKSLKEAEKRIQELKESIEKLQEEAQAFQKAMEQAVVNVGIVRYNAFAEVGGEQSFSIALLDSVKNGVVVTSHYGRETNRVYAKNLRQGASEYALSKEEERAIHKALESADQKYGTAKRTNSKKTARSRA